MEIQNYTMPSVGGLNPVQVTDLGPSTLRQAIDYAVHQYGWSKLFLPLGITLGKQLRVYEIGKPETDRAIEAYSMEKLMEEFYEPNPQLTVRRLLFRNHITAIVSDQDGVHHLEATEANAVREADPELSGLQCFDDSEYENWGEDEEGEWDEDEEGEWDEEDEDGEWDEEDEDEDWDEEDEDEDGEWEDEDGDVDLERLPDEGEAEIEPDDAVVDAGSEDGEVDIESPVDKPDGKL